MDFLLDADLTDLRDTLRRLLARADADSPLDGPRRRELWGQLRDLGVLDAGADALDPIGVLVVAEEIGRTRVRLPHAERLVGARLLTAAGHPPTDALVVLAHAEPRAPVGTRAHAVSAERDGVRWRLAGVKEPVSYAGWADAFVVSAVVDGRTRLFLVPREEALVTTYDTHDHAGAGRLDLSDASVALLEVDAEPALARAQAHGAAALCAEAVGAMDVALAMTCEYLRTRRQFGVPLRTFQVLTHRAADMFIEVEMARSITAYAAMALDQGDQPELAVSRAKVQVGRSARFVAQNAIQLHGGIGITEEHPVGHYASRLEAVEHAFGGTDHHLGILAGALDATAPVELLT